MQDISIQQEDNSQGKRLGKKTPLQNLNKKVKEYISRADDIVEKRLDDVKEGVALFRLYRYICLENGGYADDVHDSIMKKEARYINFMKHWHLYIDDEEWKEGEVLPCFLKAAESAIKKKGGGIGIGGRFYEVSGWEWHPDSGIDAASVMLWALLDAIYRYVNYLYVQIEIETGRDMGLNIAKKREDNGGRTAPVVPQSVKTELQEETLASKYDAKKLLIVYKNLTDKEYLFCTEDAWLYVWGVKVNPTNKTEIKAPAKLPRWSAMRGKKTAIGDMIRTLMATDCGKPWKKTAIVCLQ